MPSRPKRGLKSKLLRITAAIMLVLSLVTLTFVAWMNYVTESDRLADIEQNIRSSILSKGATLAASHALALKGMVADNAFSDVKDLVAGAVTEDEDVIYGAFIGADDTAWAYVSPTAMGGRALAKESWKELGIDEKALHSAAATQRKTLLFGAENQEFAVPVMSDDHERFGTVVYGLTTQRMQHAVAAAQERSRHALLKTLGMIALLGVVSFAVGTMLVSRAASRATEPIANLTAVANQIAKGERGLRVNIESGDEVEVLAAAFNHMLEANEDAIQRLEVTTQRALESDRLKSEFLANMSHEIRTPMNGVLGMVKLLESLPLDGRAWRYVKTIDASANVLLTIINDILDFSKLEAGKYTVQAVAFQPKVVIQEAVELLALRAHDQHLELIYRTDPSIPAYAVGDPDRLRQVLNNLIGNAIKFTEKGEVFVDAKVTSKTDTDLVLEVAVQDSGIGIDKADLPKLYEVFSQVDGSMDRRHGGTGLGLAICKRLVEAMGGDIQVRSELGVGSTFTFTVKLGVDERQGAASERQAGTSKKRALVVEPSKRSAEIIGEHLHAWKMTYEIVNRGLVVLDRLYQELTQPQPFDVLIVGADLEDLPIADLIKQIRSRPEFRALPIVLLTALRPGAPLTDIEREGVTEIQKPIRFSELYICLTSSLGNALLRSTAVFPRETAPDASNRKILVVDDNKINQFVAVEQLKRRGYGAEIAVNGIEALEKVKQGGFVAVLMDCQMPVMDGYTATQEIRKWETATGTSRVPIIALTAHALTGERDRVLKAGMDDYLSKPFRPADLEKVLRLHAHTGEADQPAESASGDEMLASSVTLSEPLMRLFLEEVPIQLDELGKAIDAKRAVDVAAHAHKLKGSCLGVAAGPMSEVAESLQLHADSGDLTGASAMFLQLKAHYAKVERLLKDLLAVQGSAVPKARAATQT